MGEIVEMLAEACRIRKKETKDQDKETALEEFYFPQKLTMDRRSSYFLFKKNSVNFDPVPAYFPVEVFN